MTSVVSPTPAPPPPHPSLLPPRPIPLRLPGGARSCAPRRDYHSYSSARGVGRASTRTQTPRVVGQASRRKRRRRPPPLRPATTSPLPPRFVAMLRAHPPCSAALRRQSFGEGARGMVPKSRHPQDEPNTHDLHFPSTRHFPRSRILPAVPRPSRPARHRAARPQERPPLPSRTRTPARMLRHSAPRFSLHPQRFPLTATTNPQRQTPCRHLHNRSPILPYASLLHPFD